MPPANFVSFPLHVLVKTGVGIIFWFQHTTVLDRIVVNIVEMIGKVTLVTDYVIPESPLPQLDLARYAMCFLVVQREVSLHGVQCLRNV